MKVITDAVAWIYDFLAEDPVLVIGMVVAVLLTILVVRVSSNGAGFILWATVVVAIGVSLARTASTRQG